MFHHVSAIYKGVNCFRNVKTIELLCEVFEDTAICMAEDMGMHGVVVIIRKYEYNINS